MARRLNPLVYFTLTLFGKAINWFKKSKYSHAGLSLSSTLNQIYSESISHIEKDLIKLRKEVDMLLNFKSAAIMDNG